MPSKTRICWRQIRRHLGVGLSFSALVWSQSVPASSSNPEDPSAPKIVFHAGAQLVLLDVMAQNSKSGLPINTFHKEDFKVFDNGHSVPIVAFDSGARYDTRPVALWFVVICNEKNRGVNGEYASGLFSGKEALFRPALNDLDKNDRVGVAHWCDNGDALLDLKPTLNRDTAISVLSETLKPMDYDAPIPGAGTRKGELTLQKLVRLIIDDAHQTNPQPLPVLIFLHSDHTGMPVNEINKLVDEFLETSGIAFGIKDANASDFPLGTLGNMQQGSVLHYIVESTGGQYFSIHPDLYATALQSVLLQLHFRYELGFKPPALDGKRHALKVELVGAAKDQNKDVRLRHRPEYIPQPN